MKEKINDFYRRILTAITLIGLLFCTGCGGGTSGTGLSPDSSFTGKVYFTSGQPASDLTVTLIETGASTITDAEGNFSLEASIGEDNEIQLALKGESIDTEVTLSHINEEASRSSIEITIDPENNSASVKNFDVKAEIVGECDTYFENGTTIRQANKVPQGVTCTAKVKVLADGVPKGDIPVAIQYKSCVKSDDWDTLVVGTTSPDVHHGIVQLAFPYIDSKDFCRYRIIAPYNLGEYEPVIFPIETFTSQNQKK